MCSGGYMIREVIYVTQEEEGTETCAFERLR